jgi:hypothetical protein
MPVIIAIAEAKKKEDWGLKPAQANSWQKTISKIYNSKQG